MVTKLQSSVPSLGKVPTATQASAVSFQPPGVLSTSAGLQQYDGLDQNYVYSASIGKLVKVVHELPSVPQHQHGVNGLLSSEPRCSRTPKLLSLLLLIY